MVQIITRKFPDPGPSMNRVRDERYPTGWANAPVPELTRRDNHLRLVTTTHSMFSLAVDCLKDTDTERPSAQQICHRLSALTETLQYRQSLEAGEGGERDGDIQERDQLIQQLRQENEEREGENQSLRDELQQKEEERQSLSRRLDLTNVQLQQTLERRRQVEDQLQGKIHELRESVSSKTRLLQEKEQEKYQLQRDKEGLLQEKDQFLNELRQKDALIQEGEIRESRRENQSLRDELQQKEEERERLSRRLDLTNVQIQQTLERRRQVEDQLKGKIHELQESVSSKTHLLQEKEQEKYQLQRDKEGLLQEIDQFLNELRQKDALIQEREIRESRRENQSLRDELQQKEEERERLSTRLHLTNVQIQQTLERRRQVEDQLQGEIHELRESVSNKTRLLQEKEGLLQEKEQEKDQLLREKDALIRQLQQSQQFASYTCHVSGPGLQSATANHPTHVIVEVTETSGRPCTLQQNVTAELELVSKATPTSGSRWPWSKKVQAMPLKSPVVGTAVATTSPSRYEVSYTAVSRGQHKLHVRLNDKEINGSPFTITVYPDPTQLGHPVRVVTGVKGPYGIAFNSRGEMIVNERWGHQISIFDIRGQRIRTFGSRGNRPKQMVSPAGIAIDDTDNIYVCSEHKLQKFTSSGELIKCVGQKGSKEGEFVDPRGVVLYNHQVYVCDSDNHRIQVFDLDLNFIRSIGSRGEGRGKLDSPHDIKFDSTGNMYIADFGNERVQVLDSSGHFIQLFGQEGEGRLRGPVSVLIADQYVYVSDIGQQHTVVYTSSGQFVTSFGGWGQKEGQLLDPFYITSCTDGYIYVSDLYNNRVQIF